MCETIVADNKEFIGCGALDVSTPYKFRWLGDMSGPEPYEFTRSPAPTVSHTPVCIDAMMLLGVMFGASTTEPCTLPRVTVRL